MRTRRDFLTPAIVIFGVVIVILALWVVIAEGQTHTMPGSNVVPSGASLTIQSGATITAAGGSTVTGFGGGGTPGGSNTQVQFNDSSAFGGDSAFKWNKTTDVLTLTSSLLELGISNGAWSIGNSSSATTAGSIAIGYGATAALQSLCIGYASGGSGGTNASTLIGFNTQGGANTVAVGSSATGNINAFALGASSNATGVGSIAMGYSAVAPLGAQMVVGSTGTPINNVYFGKGYTDATPTVWTLNGTGGSGTDIAGGDIAISGGAGTGTGVGGSILLKTAPAGSTGTGLNTPATRLSIGPTGTVAISGLTTNGFVKTGGGVGTLSVDTATYQASAATLTSWAAITRASGIDTFATTPSSANLRGALTDENGTGAALFSGATSPDFTTGITVGAAAASGKLLQGNGTVYTASTPTWPTTGGTAGYHVKSDGTNFSAYPDSLANSSVSSQSPSTSDVYLTGSNVTVAAGDFKAKGQYRCLFDVTKSAGTGTIVISLRVGTAGAIGDTAILTFTLPSAGTSVADVGTFEIAATWRTVGSGTSAVLQGICRANKNTATAAGLWGTANDSQTIVATTSSGFNSSTATNMGVSFNGSTAFAGTITLVQSMLEQP